MKLVELKCPNCDAPIDVPTGATRVMCEYCRSEFFLDSEKGGIVKSVPKKVEIPKWEPHYDIECDDGPADPRPQERAVRCEPPAPVVPAPKKRRTWPWVLGWIICFPIPLSVLIWRHRQWPAWVRVALIVALWLVMSAIGSANNA